jgi:hypothetical protein
VTVNFNDILATVQLGLFGEEIHASFHQNAEKTIIWMKI